VVSQAIARLQQATGAAGTTILKLMTDHLTFRLQLDSERLSASLGWPSKGSRSKISKPACRLWKRRRRR
jgi:hypothetical protein